MASHVTPGYNPEVSLLQGGTAPIVPVQGGGGGMEAGASLPAGYNPNQSLLNVGQNAPIMAIRGGGDDDLAYDKYVIEQYDPPLVSIPIPKLPTTEAQKSLVQAYISVSKPFVNELKSFIADPTPYRSTGQDNPTYQICPTPGGRRRLPSNFFQGVRKRVVIIEAENPHIWIVHNLQGNISKFLQYMKLIPQDKDGVLDPNHYVFLTGSIFSDDITNNLNFYNQFLLIKQKNMEHFYSINDLSEKFVNISCSIMNNIYSPVYLSKEGMRNTVFTFNEPDIVIFKKQHLLFKNSELPLQRDDMTVNLSSVLEKPDPEKKYKSFLIVPLIGANEEFASNMSDAPNKKKYVIFDFNPNTPKKIVLPSTSELACPKDDTCSNFKGGYSLSKINDDKRFDIGGVFHLYKNEDKMPFLKKPGAKLTPEEEEALPGAPPKKPEEIPEEKEEEEKEEEKEEEEEEKEEKPELNEETKKLLALKPMHFKRKGPDEPFKSDSSAVEGKEQDIEINAIIFRLRVPLDKKVYDDWKNGKFTQNEVEFLHALRFTPQLLSDTFGKNAWKVRLATFMESLLLSNCFQDTTLLMKLECSNAQQFVKQVYFQMYKRLLGDLYDEMGIVKPKTLADLFAGLRGLGRLGPTKSIFSISKYDYTGDLLERFQTIHYNKEKQEYYTDFAKMTEATRELLQKMRLHRVEDKDIEEITRVILERMKIPVPIKKGPGAPPVPPVPPVSPPSDPSLYKWEEIRDYSPISDTFFKSIFTKDDGLCFYRAILKGLQSTPVPDSTGSATPVVYEPSEAESIAFVKEIKRYLLANKASIVVKSDKDRPVEEHFDTKYKAKAGEAKEAPAAANDRIRTNGVYKKLSFTEFVDLLDNPDPAIRPFAEVQDAGIGTAAGRIKDVVILIYISVGANYNLISFYNEDLAKKGPLPLSKFLFLHHVGGNHFNLLKLNPGSTWPHLKAGGQVEEVLELGEAVEEVLDLGDALPLEEPKRYRKRSLRNKPRKNRQTKKHRK